MPAYRNRPDRRKAQLSPTAALIAAMTYEVTNSTDTTFELTFDAPVITSDDDITDLDLVALDIHAQDGVTGDPVVIANAQLSEDRLTLTANIDPSAANQYVVWIRGRTSNLRGPNGEYIDSDPHFCGI